MTRLMAMRKAPLTIDGAQGEGGGQILRSALALSLLLQQPVHLVNIRAGRKQPGLRPQHLAAVEAAARVGQAQVEGAHLGSRTLTFHPQGVRPGNYHIRIPTAGSVTLVLQAVLLPLALAGGTSTLHLSGGTHVPWSPTYEYLDWHLRPFLERLGIFLQATLRQAGFYPEGGGELVVRIRPAEEPLHPLRLHQRGALVGVRGLSAVANLPDHILQRQKHQALRRLQGLPCPVKVQTARLPSPGQGTVVALRAEAEQGAGCFTALGAKGKPAERVADEAIEALLAYLNSEAALDAHLADQLLLPLAFAAGPSAFTTERVTEHLRTLAWLLETFGVAQVTLEESSPARVTVAPALPRPTPA